MNELFRRLARRFVLLVAGALSAGGANAHHSQAPYDMEAEVVVEGTIVELEWRNPHIAMMLEAVGEDGETYLQEVEVASVSEVRALGVEESDIPIGARVAVRAFPGRRGPTARVFGLDFTNGDGTRLPLHPFAGFANTPDNRVPATGLAGRWAPRSEGLTETFGELINWPYTDAARTALQGALARTGASLGVCEDFPPPLLSIFPDLREIEVGESTVLMRFEAQGQNVVRVIQLDEEHPADIEPSLLGHSIGRWEGDTLVVDTAGFTGHPHGIFAWVPSGRAKHLTERFTLSEDRFQLHYEFRLEDPESLTEPVVHTSLWDYRPDLDPSGVACDPEIAARLLREVD